MRIVGSLIWFDESPSWLATAVSGMGRLCDDIVAVDGGYRLFPGARARSHPQQAEAVLSAAEASGTGCVVHRPQDIWYGNEVEKRNHALSLCATLNPDWLVVFDADYHVLQMEPELIRAELEATDLDVATYTILDGKDMLGDEALAMYAREREASTEWTVRTRDIYRWHPSLKVGPSHWCYWSEPSGWLRGPIEQLAEPLHLEDKLVVYHRNQDRAKVRRDAAYGYYKNREAARTEWTSEETLALAQGGK